MRLVPFMTSRKKKLNEIIQRIEDIELPARRSKKIYFTPRNQQAIIEYNNTSDEFIRSQIYEKYIHYPLNKIAENLINKKKFYHFDEPFEDVKHRAVVHLIEKLPKYTKEKGKAFSYFTKICLNWLIFNNNKEYKGKVAKVDLEVVDEERIIINEVKRDDFKESLSDFFQLFIKHIETIAPKKFTNHNDYIAAMAILDLFKGVDNIENYHKKALFIYIREQTDLKTTTITKVLKVFKNEFKRLFRQYNTQSYRPTNI